jgi:hypothetical protein
MNGILSCLFSFFALPSAKKENEVQRKVPLCRRLKMLTA